MNCVSTGLIFDRFTAVSSQFSFAAVGDIMVHSSQLDLNYDRTAKTFDFDQSFQFVTSYLQGNDFVIGNLETTISANPKSYSGYPLFSSPPELVEATKKAGFTILSTANNHSADKGSSGILTTLDVLEKNSILSLGTYRDEEDYKERKDLLLERDGFKILFYNYTYGTNGMKVPSPTIVRILTEESIRTDLENAKSLEADLIIVALHYGPEYVRKPSNDMKKWVEFAFFEGADIVLGGHPHVLQKFEIQNKMDRYGIQKDRLVFYSMGNFLSGQRKPHTDGGAVFRWNVNLYKSQWKDITRITYNQVHYVPTWVYPNQRNNKPNFAILPIPEFLDDSGNIYDPMPYNLQLSKRDIRDIQFFYKSTKELLGDPSGILPF